MKTKVLLIALLVLSLSASGFAANRNILDVQPIPNLDPEIAALESAIGFWDGEGRIDALYKGRVVINDANFKTTADLEIITIDGTPYTETLRTGLFVYFFIDARKTLTKLAVDTTK
ncbi:MAG: hypothetical protein V6Z89_20365 [Desulfobacter sp.]